MRYDLVGAVLLGISAFLYASRYFAAALFMGPGLSNWNADLFRAAYGYVGDGLTRWAIVALFVGVVSLALGAIIDFRTNLGTKRGRGERD
ncbi:MAG: hypothetical protein EPO21_14500 [Chloroflexota bacterium]|nr:MAG: hypothetical protein EPO21_14500 [Chloroflexota bacterium]